MDLQRVKRELELFSGEESKLQITVYMTLQVFSRLEQTKHRSNGQRCKNQSWQTNGDKPGLTAVSLLVLYHIILQVDVVLVKHLWPLCPPALAGPHLQWQEGAPAACEREEKGFR